MTIYPLSTLRKLALHAQSLTIPNGTTAIPTLAELYRTVERLGCVQIDTLQMVQRSHYLVLWSRLGKYDAVDFDRLIYDAQHRCLFEGWQHAASIIPLKDYRYQMPHQRRMREQPGKWFQNWAAQPGHEEMMGLVLDRIRQGGAVRAGDFEYKGPPRNGWWDWKPAKVALEFLYAYGNLMIVERQNFQRFYDLTERIMPDWVDTREPTIEERDRYWVEQGIRSLGICTPSQAGDYSYRKRVVSAPIVKSLLSEGVINIVEGKGENGKSRSWLVHRDNLQALQQSADGELRAERTTFLSPFDSLFWAHRRDELLWGFHQALEAYIPAGKRVWGYFCLPILHGERLVGRFDPKLERDKGTLRIKALYLEEGTEPEAALISGVARAMRDFMAFHASTELIIERSQPQDFGEKILATL